MVTILAWQFSVAIIIGSTLFLSTAKGSAPRFSNKHTILTKTTTKIKLEFFYCLYYFLKTKKTRLLKVFYNCGMMQCCLTIKIARIQLDTVKQK